MQAIESLKQAGFDVWLEDEKIKYKLQSGSKVNKVWLNNLLAEIRARKEDAIRYLKPQPMGPNFGDTSPVIADQQVTDTQGIWSIIDCPSCSCYIHWPNYPLGGGTRNFCGYWIYFEGKSKKVEVLKVKNCPKIG